MEAQMCKLCGVRHHRYEPHQFSTLDGTKTVAVEINEDSHPHPKQVLSKTGRPNKSDLVDERGYFDRNAYQREYMRKRRARLRPF